MKALLGTNEEDFRAAYWRHREAYDRGALGSAAYWTAVASDLNHEVDSTLITSLNESDVALWTKPNHDMIAWAKALQKAGYKTGILSNIGDAMEAGIMTRFDWLHEFNHHTFSHRLGMAKPDLAIYGYAAQGLGEEPNRILFVDDREENILAAREVGMTAVQYLGHEAFRTAMHEAGLQSLLHPKSVS
jgi:putative hydrolase of the HAD superfamily